LGYWTAHANGACEHCGPFRVRTSHVTVRQRIDDGTWSYRVRCPRCRVWIVAAAGPRVALQLLVAQAPLERWSLPPEERERGDGPTVSLNDLASLRADLTRRDVVDALRETLDTVEH
jgi:uncharacterized Zn finger protein